MSLKENLQAETVKNLSLRDTVTVDASATVQDAIEAMRKKQLGCVIVVDDDGRGLGQFTERTMIHILLEQPSSLSDLFVKDHLESDWFTATLETPVCDICKMILEQHARFICVLDEEGRPIGLTGQRGISEYIADHYPHQVMVQRVSGRIGMESQEGA